MIFDARFCFAGKSPPLPFFLVFRPSFLSVTDETGVLRFVGAQALNWYRNRRVPLRFYAVVGQQSASPGKMTDEACSGRSRCCGHDSKMGLLQLRPVNVGEGIEVETGGKWFCFGFGRGVAGLAVLPEFVAGFWGSQIPVTVFLATRNLLPNPFTRSQNPVLMHRNPTPNSEKRF